MKQHSEEGSEQQKTQTIKSCQPIIQEDIVNSKTKTEKFARVARSQQNLSETKIWDHLNQTEKHNYIQQTNKNLGAKKKPISDIKNVGTDFPIQTVQSQEIEFDGESYRSTSLKGKAQDLKQKGNQIQNQEKIAQKQGSDSQEQFTPQLNILVAGGQDTGKTTFVQCFFNKSRKSNQKAIKQKTKQLTIISDLGIKYQDEFNHNNRIDFIDFPGFKFDQLSSYIHQIWNYALQKCQKYEKLKKANKHKRYKDERIHCCLFFIQGPRIKQIDYHAIKQLGLLFNVIPIIAKADSYTVKEIKQIKQTFNQVKLEKDLNLYDIKEFLVQKYPEKLQELQNGPFEKAPPFAISASLQTLKQRDFDQKHIRQYRWGICQIQNENHSDFLLLKELLSKFLRKNLIQSTKIVEKQLKLEEDNMKKQYNKSNCMTLSIVGLAITGALLISGYKLGIFNSK